MAEPFVNDNRLSSDVEGQMTTKQKIILDTDIGTDVDDAWALATALGSPELDLVGVTTVYGDTTLRGAMTRKLLMLAGRPDIPVAPGAEQPLPGAPSLYWLGHEGQGLLNFDGSDPQDFHPLPASDFIIERSHHYAGELLLVAIGPLTNVATVLQKDPSLVTRLRRVGLMGGGSRQWRNRNEQNFRADPKAAEVVLRSGVPVKMVGYNVTERCRFRWRELTQMTAGQKPFVAALRALTDRYLHALQIEKEARWQRTGKASYQKWLADPCTWLHDPLTVATAANPTLVSFAATELSVNETGLTAPMHAWQTPPAWSATVEMGQKASGGEFKQFLQPRLQRFFATL
jgi:purine nucleosidase